LRLPQTAPSPSTVAVAFDYGKQRAYVALKTHFGSITVLSQFQSQLNASLSAWKKMFGADEEELRVEYQRNESDADMSKLDEPKVGKFDPNNAPHVGGNTWAGGTGELASIFIS
jgi:hypothetical protein